MAMHERKFANLTLRLAGLLLLGLAFLIGRHLFASPDSAGKTSAAAYLFALIFMASVSGGAALAVLGRHLFDQVELPARWTIHLPERRGSADLGACEPR